jgi:hypothetical protein
LQYAQGDAVKYGQAVFVLYSIIADVVMSNTQSANYLKW